MFKNEPQNAEQGISNDEVKSLLFLLSAFVIRYSIFCGSLLSIYAACREVKRSDSKPDLQLIAIKKGARRPPSLFITANGRIKSIF